MKILIIVLSSVSILLMLSTLICGAWLRSKGADPSGIAFHVKIAVSTIIFTLVSFALLISRAMKG